MDISKISQGYINQRIADEKKNMSKQDVANCNEGLSYADVNGDGKTSGIEMYKEWSETCQNLFEGNSAFQQKGEELSIQFGELYSRYAGTDGVLDAYEYNAALQSDEMGVLLEQYWEMKDIVEAQNGEDVKGLEYYDKNFDGNVTAKELKNSKIDLYSKVFENNKKSENEAKKIAKEQAKILDKYAGDDGVLSSEEYSEAIKSTEYQKTVARYMNLES